MEAVFTGEGHDRIHLGGLSEKINRNDRTGFGCDFPAGSGTLMLKHTGQLSTNTGIAPTRAMQPAVAKNV